MLRQSLQNIHELMYIEHIYQHDKYKIKLLCYNASFFV